MPVHLLCLIAAMTGLMFAPAVRADIAPGGCDADLDDSGTVDGIDLGILLANWSIPHTAPGCGLPAGSKPGACAADLNLDGFVNGLDLGILLAHWAEICDRPTAPRIIYTPVAHEGDPAPGIDFPGAFLDFMLTPQIDAEGNVLFKSFIGAPGLGEVGNQAIFYGAPGTPGGVTKLIWESDPAPGFPDGVTIRNLFFSNERLCEAGIVTFTAQVEGPGITPGFNDMVIYYGDPRIAGDIQPAFQTSDQAPGLDAGVVFSYTGPSSIFASEISDNGTLFVFANLAGPGVTGVNNHSIWSGAPDNLQLVWRKGMQAPGTAPGVTFTWADFVSVNDAGQIAFRGNLTGPGIIDGVNNTGRWVGGPGSLQVFAWNGMPAPGLPEGTTFQVAGGGVTSTNFSGDMYAVSLVQGPDVSSSNDMVLHIGQPGDMELVMREGDPLPEAGDEVVAGDSFGNCFVKNESEAFFALRLGGGDVEGLNQWASYFGRFDKPSLELRDGQQAPMLDQGINLSRVVFTASRTALNDVGDIVTVTEVEGPGVTSATKSVLWRKIAAENLWMPLVRGGDQVDGRIVFVPTAGAFLSSFWMGTGGADGYGLSFNNNAQLSIRLEFTDGLDGIYVIQTNP